MRAQQAAQTGNGRIAGARWSLTAPHLVAWLCAAVFVVGLIFFAAIKVQTRAPVGLLTRDPQTTAEGPWYLGLASSLGIVGWSVAAALFAFGAAVVRSAGARDRQFATLAWAAALTVLLLLDDLLLIHDDILYRAIGAEEPVLAVYGVVFLAWLLVYGSGVSGSARMPLALAVGWFGASVGVDLVWNSDSEWRLVVEDGAKFVGIWLWAVFAMVLCAGCVASTLGRDDSAVP